MICEWCRSDDLSTTDSGPCMVAHCWECFTNCPACCSQLADDFEGER